VSDGVVVNPVDTYRDCRTLTVTVEVPHPEIGEAVAAVLEGNRYSKSGCVQAFIHDKFDKQLPIGLPGGNFCSEVGVRVLRGDGLLLFPGQPAKEIMPSHLLAALSPLNIGGDDE
jgi:hypothetical protein